MAVNPADSLETPLLARVRGSSGAPSAVSIVTSTRSWSSRVSSSRGRAGSTAPSPKILRRYSSAMPGATHSAVQAETVSRTMGYTVEPGPMSRVNSPAVSSRSSR